MPEKQIKCVIYARVSTKDKEQHVDNQVDILTELALRHGWNIFDTYVEEVSAVKHRAQLARLQRDAKRKLFDVILVTKIDRLARSLRDLIGLIDELVVQKNIRVWFVDQNLDVDPRSPVNMLTVHLLGAVAEFERALISERVKAGLLAASNKGVKLGQPRKFIDQAKLVDMRNSGKSLTEMQREFKTSRNTVIKNLRALGLIVNPVGKFRENLQENNKVA